MTLLVALALSAVALLIRFTVQHIQRTRLAAELKTDWWPRFERDLNAYMSRSWASAREAERRIS